MYTNGMEVICHRQHGMAAPGFKECNLSIIRHSGSDGIVSGLRRSICLIVNCGIILHQHGLGSTFFLAGE